MAKLTPGERDQVAASLVDWAVDGEVLRRTFVFKNFVEAMGFVTRVGLAAEKANHHPDIDIRWNKVTLALTTHDEGGLSRRDVELAERIDTLG